MKKLFFSSIFLFICIYANAQEKINYSGKSGKIEFVISADEFYTEYTAKDATVVEVSAKEGFVRVNENAAIVKLKNLSGDFFSRKNQLKSKFNNIFNRIEPVLIFSDGVKQIAKGEINIKLKPGYNIQDIINGYDFGANPLSIADNLFTITSKTISTTDLFSIVGKFQSDNRVEFAEPNFTREIIPFTNDPYFGSQWAIKNQGYLGGTVGADMKVEQAWNYVTGSGIKVAIIDEGVDLNHQDLQANLLAGFDATGNNSSGGPNFSNNDAHGTSCAGIVSAVANNGIGTVGVAYNAKIIPIRIAYSNGYPLGDYRRTWVTQDSWIVSGINWAWQNGADVLSNSWGGGSYSSAIASAVTNAVTNGRNGKGCVVFFASGNNNSSVSFPATLDNVIAVGASSPCDTRKTPTSCDGETWWGGNYGTGLDVMSPGVKIYTTDISGSDGYMPSDYISDFNGTSSACPNAASVVALILSANPNLNSQQARNILETTCDKVGGYNYNANVSGQPNGTWCSDAGYGRVNAFQAVQTAMCGNLSSISGNAILCTNGVYTVSGVPLGNTVTWSATPSGIVGIQPNGNSVTVTKVTDGNVTLNAIIAGCGNGNISKSISVGTPSLSISGDIPCQPGKIIQPVTFYATPELPNTYYNWRWVQNGTSSSIFTSGQGTSSVSRKFPLGSYQIYVSADNECGTGNEASLYFNILPCSSGGTYLLSVYPNPTNTNINLQIIQNTGQETMSANNDVVIPTKKFESAGKTIITITNAYTNELVKQKRINEITGSYYQIDLTGVPQGLYILQLDRDNEAKAIKIMVQ